MHRKKKLRKIKWSITLVILIIILAFVTFNRYYPLPYIDIINECAEEYGLTQEFICAVIHAESKFNKEAISKKDARGLMQITERTAYWLAKELNIENFNYNQIFDPEINIRLGCYYLSKLEKQYNDMDVALSAYNAGSGNVSTWLKNPEYSDDGKTLKYIPFQETRDYVKRVSYNQKVYSFILKVKHILN